MKLCDPKTPMIVHKCTDYGEQTEVLRQEETSCLISITETARMKCMSIFNMTVQVRIFDFKKTRKEKKQKIWIMPSWTSLQKKVIVMMGYINYLDSCWKTNLAKNARSKISPSGFAGCLIFQKTEEEKMELVLLDKILINRENPD